MPRVWTDPNTHSAGQAVSSTHRNQENENVWYVRERQDRLMTLGGATPATIGMLVQQDTSAADKVGLVSTANSTARVGVALSSITAASTGYIRWGGLADVYVGTAAVSVGDYIATSSTAGVGQVSTTNPIGRALTSKAGGVGTEGTVVVLLDPLGWYTAGQPWPGALIYPSGTQTLSTATAAPVAMDSESEDTATLHFPSTAALTGTVAKTAASNALVGTGTTFATELSVGQIIDVPGTVTERRVVTAITDATNLTVNGNFAHTASGQTAARTNAGLVIRQAGRYVVSGQVAFAASATGRRIASLRRNTLAAIGAQASAFCYATPPAPSTGAAVIPLAAARTFAQWDYVELWAQQDSSGNLDTVAGVDNTWLSVARMLG